MAPSQQTKALRPELTALPERLQALPVHRGYPVPWFVAWVNGEPEFRAADPQKWVTAVRDRRCWVCGQQLGSFLAFVLGPMCGITRTTSEPACHRECALWSVRNCPFLTRPHMERREDNLPLGTVDAPGLPLHRNPGVSLIWMTRTFKVFDAGDGRALIQVGEPVALEYFAEGRAATREEIDNSIAGGLPTLVATAVAEGQDALSDLYDRYRQFAKHLPWELSQPWEVPDGL